jgi:elongation factor P--(R)-beta-lysine ligase
MDIETVFIRGAFIRALRDFFHGIGYTETDTPILSPALIPESSIGAFRTEFEPPFGSKKELFLTPSPELWMKRLIAGGSGNIFQVSHCFRNRESVGRIHNPEFTMLEWYTMGCGYLDSLALTERLFAALVPAFRAIMADNGLGEADAARLDRLLPPFRRLSMREAFREYAGFDLAARESLGALSGEAERLGLAVSRDSTWESVFNQIFLTLIEPALAGIGPVAIHDYPAEIRCLAKGIPGTPWNERWELYAGGIELANCFTEETDPTAVRSYYDREISALSAAGTRVKADEALLESFGAGFPACSGVALGVDRLLMAFLGRSSIEALIFFPYSDRMA